MTWGPGAYDDLATYVRETAEADGVMVLVVNGKHGHGFSCQALPSLPPTRLAAMLEAVAKQMIQDEAAR